MMESLGKINWEDFEEAMPAFLTAITMPLAYSISTGISVGFIFYVLTKVVRGKFKEVHPVMYAVTILFIINYIITGALKL